MRRQIERYRKVRLLRELADSKKPFGVMNGTLGGISFADLLQLVGLLGPQDLRVHVRSPLRGVGEVFLSRGNIMHATAEGFTGGKALHRMLDWYEGLYSVTQKSFDGEATVARSIDACLLDGLSALDHKRRLVSQLGSGETLLAVDHSPQGLTRSFDKESATILSLIESHHTLDAVLDHSELSDLETLRVMDELLRTGTLLYGPEI